MSRLRFLFATMALLFCGLAIGCGGSKDRGKNQDFDRPKASERK